MSGADIIVVGGGIIGMLTARELRLAGAEVLLLERGQPGRESSWAGGGIISPLYPWRYADAVSELARWSQAHYPELAAQLEADTGISPQWTRNGLLILDTDERAQAESWAERFGARLDCLDAQALASIEPHLANPPTAALWMADVAQVRNPRLVKSLRAEMDRLGIRVYAQTAVDALWLDEGRVRGVLAGSQRHAAAQVVVCAGAWSAALFPPGLVVPAVKPVRGQMILFRAEPGDIQRITLFDGHYCIPRRDGRVLMGSTLEHVGFDPATTAEARVSLQALAVQRFPVLDRYPVEHHWAGLRPGAPEGVPFIAEHPEADNLFLNVGHDRNGVVLGPASARLVVDLMLGRAPILDPAPYGLQAPRRLSY